jgi:hypothetical protein
MGFLDSLSKTLTTGVDRAKFEADKFQRTSRISGEINNIKSQIDTNIRQLGERALELYQQGSLTAPEIASLAQIIGQLRDQQNQKESELNVAQSETFETWQPTQSTTTPTSPAQNVPIMNETTTSYPPQSSIPTSSYTPQANTTSTPQAPHFTGRSYDLPESTDLSGTGLPNSSSIGGQPAMSSMPYSLPESADLSGTGLPNSGSIGGQPAVGDTPYACPNCGHSIPNNAVFCPNCGTRTARV